METNRILLRPWRESDAEVLYRFASDPEVGPRAGWPPHKSVEESLEIIRTIFHSDHMWAIELKECGQPIGCMGYMVHGESNIDIGENDVETGYWIARPYWNKGICTEALRLLIDYCFREKGFSTLWADYFPENPASGKVMEKCGFRDTGQVNRCSRLQLGSDRPVRIMRLDSYVKNSLIIHSSQYGATRRYAERLAELTGIRCVSLHEAPNLDDYRQIIFFGALYAGSVLGLKKLAPSLTTQRLIVATVGLADPTDPVNIDHIRASIRRQIPAALYDEQRIFPLHGAIDYRRLSLKHRLMMAVVHSKVAKMPEEKLTAETRAVLDTYGKQVDYIDFNALQPISDILKTI